MKAVGYIRVSTEEQAYGIEAQKVAIENFCRTRNYELVDVFVDEGVSGSIPAFERPGFKQAIEYAKSNNIKILIIYALDRLGRSFYDIFETLKKLEFEFGIQVISIREEFLQTLDPRIRALILSILSWASWYERFLIRERTRLAMQKAKEKLKRVELTPEQEELIILAYKSGKSIRKIAQAMKISEFKVRQVLVKHGLLTVPEDVCPKCFHKMKFDDQYQTLYCPNCGYLKVK